MTFWGYPKVSPRSTFLLPREEDNIRSKRRVEVKSRTLRKNSCKLDFRNFIVFGEAAPIKAHELRSCRKNVEQILDLKFQTMEVPSSNHDTYWQIMHSRWFR